VAVWVHRRAAAAGITLVESDTIGTIGVDEADFMQVTGATMFPQRLIRA
jgi:hypothetical protein